jgi:hypothetical protein
MLRFGWIKVQLVGEDFKDDVFFTRSSTTFDLNVIFDAGSSVTT